MRVRIVFQLKNKGGVLPFHHQNLIRSLLNNVVNRQYFDDNPFFNYSGMKGQTKVGRSGLHYFSKRVTLVFGSLKEDVTETLVNSLFKLDEVRIGDLYLEPEYVEKEGERNYTEESKYLCISPLVICNSDSITMNKSFIHPTTEEFAELVRKSTLERMQAAGIDASSIDRNFLLTADEYYLKKIQDNEKKFARIYSTIFKDEIKEIRGYTLPFTLKADTDVHKFIFASGFGELCENGFGMIDAVDKEQLPRTIYHRK